MGANSKKGPLSGIANALAADWVKGGILALVPTATTAVTALSAYMRAVPVWQIVTASAVTFAAVITVIRGFVEVSWRIRIKGRLVCAGAHGLIHQLPNGTIDMVGVGLNLVNQSSRLIEYKSTEVTLIVDGRVNPAPTIDQAAPAVIPPASVFLFRADTVPISTPKAGKMINFTYRAKIAYGEPGDMRYETEVRLKGTYTFKSPTEVAIFEALLD